MDAHRPEPPDQTYIPIEEDNPIYIDKILGEHLGTIAFSKSYWDFANSAWVWGHNDPVKVDVYNSGILDKAKEELLKTNLEFINCKTQEETDALLKYRQQLRNLEKTLKGKFGPDIKLPRSPKEIVQLKFEAANGCEISQKTIEEEGL
jgi:hypothetical protein